MLGQLESGDNIFLEYEVLELAGVGATSFVYKCRARDPKLPDVVAVKVLHNKFVFDSQARKQFLHEASLMRSIQHENVVELYDVIDMPGQVAFVMEHVEGPTLQQWQSRTADSRTDRDLCTIFVGVLRGLEHAHREGIVHRDLKPANIMIDERGDEPVAKIIDFGVARRLADGPSPADFEAIRGTAAYMSPDEIRSPHDVCEASDLYSLGVMLYELCTGTRPFTDRAPTDLMEAHLSETPTRPSDHNPDVSPALEAVILRSLAKKPRERFRDAASLSIAIQHATGLARDIHSAQLKRPTLPPATPELRRWARSRMVSRFRRAVSIAVDWFFNPGVTGHTCDPHYLARPHVELLVV